MITLYLMTEKGYSVIQSLQENNLLHQIERVIGARDRNVQKDYFEEICTFCEKHQVPFFERTKAPANTSAYSIAISWRWLIDSPNLIVLHDSLLPRYRGFAPLVAALINGEQEVGVSALFADATFDTGDIIAQRSFKVTYPMKIDEAIKVIAPLYSEIVVDVVQKLQSSGEIIAVKQDNEHASYSLWRDEEDYRIDWNRSANEIVRFIDAVGYPYKGAATLVNGEQARINAATEVPDVKIEIRTAGKVLFMQDGKPVVVCGSGLLRVDEMVWENGINALPLKNFRTRFK